MEYTQLKILLSYDIIFIVFKQFKIEKNKRTI